jgi:putative polyketide hydroxylase
MERGKERTEVLVVGGSLVGLASALFLAWQDVPVIMVERHPGSSPHPRAIGYTERTVELLRAVGLANKIAQIPSGFRLRRARVESLAGKWYEESAWTPKETQSEEPEYSPVRSAAIAQDRIEPILRQRSIELGADVRLSTQFLRFEQDADGITAVLRRRDDGNEYTVRASYLIAADGGASPIREQLGIARRGRGHMKTVHSVLFKAPLEQYLAKGVMQFDIDQPDLRAFLTTYNDGRWVLMFTDERERDEHGTREAITKAIGRTDIPIEVITTGRWELGAVVNDTFISGRVFFVGDSAHALPPTRGGYGANTGIHDAHNLSWKIAAVLSGKSSPQLLNTYDHERRPVAWVRHQQIFARPDYQAEAAGHVVIDPIIDDVSMELGQIYRSASVIGAAACLPVAQRPDQWNGQPGTRAAHLWVNKAGERLSTLDLLQRKWALFSETASWKNAVAIANEQTGIAVETFVFGSDVTPEKPEEFRTLYGLGHHGACLIRPDGFIAWRATELLDDAATDLAKVLAQVACCVRHP